MSLDPPESRSYQLKTASFDEHSDSIARERESRTVLAEKMLAVKLQQATATIVRASNGLPKIGDGYELYASYSDFAKFMEQQKLRIILAMRKLLTSVGCRVKISAFGLEDTEKIIFANDLLIERIGISLEDHQMLLTQELIVKSKLNTGAEAIVGTSSQLYSAGSKSLGIRDGGRYAQMFGKNIYGNVESIRLSSNDGSGWESNCVVIADEEIPSVIARCNLLKANMKIVEEKDESEVPFMLIVGETGRTMVGRLPHHAAHREFEKSGHIYVTDERSEEVKKENETKLKRVMERLSKWVPPYDCYLSAKKN